MSTTTFESPNLGVISVAPETSIIFATFPIESKYLLAILGKDVATFIDSGKSSDFS